MQLVSKKVFTDASRFPTKHCEKNRIIPNVLGQNSFRNFKPINELEFRIVYLICLAKEIAISRKLLGHSSKLIILASGNLGTVIPSTKDEEGWA